MIRRLSSAVYGGVMGLIAGGFVGLLIGNVVDDVVQSGHEFKTYNGDRVLVFAKYGALLGAVFFSICWGYFKGPPPD